MNPDDTTPIENFWLEEIQNGEDQGHNYIPEKGVFRSSLLPYCDRKNILAKSPKWVEVPIIIQKSEIPIALGKNISGQGVHSFTQKDLLKDNPKVIAIEPHVSKIFKNSILDVKLEGHIDLILHLETGIAIVDIKTFERNDKYNIEDYLPNQHHLDQLAIYMSITGINQGYLLYINRSNYEPLFYRLSISDQAIRFNSLLQKAFNLAKVEHSEELPPRIGLKWDDYNNYYKFDFQCNYCEFQGFCYPNGAVQE